MCHGFVGALGHLTGRSDLKKISSRYKISYSVSKIIVQKS